MLLKKSIAYVWMLKFCGTLMYLQYHFKLLNLTCVIVDLKYYFEHIYIYSSDMNLMINTYNGNHYPI